MSHRLISSEQLHLNFNRELNLIKHIALTNYYKVNMVNQILNRYLFEQVIIEIYPHFKDL